MDPRTIILILIVAAIIYVYFGWKVLLWCALIGIIIAVIAFIRVVLRAEGKTKKFEKSLEKSAEKRKEKINNTMKKIVKWWEEF